MLRKQPIFEIPMSTVKFLHNLSVKKGTPFKMPSILVSSLSFPCDDLKQKVTRLCERVSFQDQQIKDAKICAD